VVLRYAQSNMYWLCNSGGIVEIPFTSWLSGLIHPVHQHVRQNVTAHSFILSRHDYCNSLFICHGQSFNLCSMRWMQQLNQSWTCRYVTTWNQRWLPVKHRITYKLCLFMQYLTCCISTVSTADGRYRLRLTVSSDYVLPRTRTKFGERGVCYSSPATWKSPPSDLHDITNTNTIKKPLQCIFRLCYSVTILWHSWMLRTVVSYKSYLELELN